MLRSRITVYTTQLVELSAHGHCMERSLAKVHQTEWRHRLHSEHLMCWGLGTVHRLGGCCGLRMYIEGSEQLGETPSLVDTYTLPQHSPTHTLPQQSSGGGQGGEWWQPGWVPQWWQTGWRVVGDRVGTTVVASLQSPARVCASPLKMPACHRVSAAESDRWSN